MVWFRIVYGTRNDPGVQRFAFMDEMDGCWVVWVAFSACWHSGSLIFFSSWDHMIDW